MRFLFVVNCSSTFYHLGMFKEFNANPKSNRVGDCAIRAIARVTGLSWEEVFISVCLRGLALSDMPSSNYVWGTYLEDIGYTRHMVPTYMTVKEFAERHPQGRYVLCISGHVVACVDGDYYDSWDSGDEIPLYYWKERK